MLLVPHRGAVKYPLCYTLSKNYSTIHSILEPKHSHLNLNRRKTKPHLSTDKSLFFLLGHSPYKMFLVGFDFKMDLFLKKTNTQHFLWLFGYTLINKSLPWQTKFCKPWWMNVSEEERVFHGTFWSWGLQEMLLCILVTGCIKLQRIDF